MEIWVDSSLFFWISKLVIKSECITAINSFGEVRFVIGVLLFQSLLCGREIWLILVFQSQPLNEGNYWKLIALVQLKHLNKWLAQFHIKFLWALRLFRFALFLILSEGFSLSFPMWCFKWKVKCYRIPRQIFSISKLSQNYLSISFSSFLRPQNFSIRKWVECSSSTL